MLRQAAALMKAPRRVQEPSAEPGILLSENSRRTGRCPPEGAESPQTDEACAAVA